MISSEKRALLIVSKKDHHRRVPLNIAKITSNTHEFTPRYLTPSKYQYELIIREVEQQKALFCDDLYLVVNYTVCTRWKYKFLVG